MPQGLGDERRISQVLINLVGNAIKFTDHGWVDIDASADNGWFAVEVRDTGRGIAETDQARIFEEFQQVDDGVARSNGGTGLGLAITRRMIKMHGGELGVRSRIGEGATFWFRVPIIAREADVAA
jgi:signal transduction histidine kinase